MQQESDGRGNDAGRAIVLKERRGKNVMWISLVGGREKEGEELAGR